MINKEDVEDLIVKLDDWESYSGNIHLFPQEADLIVEALALYKEIYFG